MTPPTFAADRWLVVEISQASLVMRGVGAKYPQARIVFVGRRPKAVEFAETGSHRVKPGHVLLLCPFFVVESPTAAAPTPNDFLTLEKNDG